MPGRANTVRDRFWCRLLFCALLIGRLAVEGFQTAFQRAGADSELW